MSKASALYALADTIFDLGCIDVIQPVNDTLFLVVVNGFPIYVNDESQTQRPALCWAWTCWRLNHTRTGSL